MAIEKIKVLGAVLEIPAELNRQRCLAGSSKTAPRILIFLIAMGDKYLSYVKSIATFAVTFLVIASVMRAPICGQFWCNWP